MRAWLPLALLVAGCAQAVTCPVGQLNEGVIVGGLAIAPVSQVHPGATDPVTQEVPLAGADVYMADAADLALPGKHYPTDANGRFDLSRAAPDASVQIIAKQGAIVERSLVNPGQTGANVNVNVASTILTRALLEGLTGRLGPFNPASFVKAVELVYGHLRQEPKYDPTGNLDRFKSWIQADTELKSLYDELRAALGKPTGSYADLVTTLAQLNGQVPPSFGPSASPSPKASSEPSATDAASPEPTPTPTPVAPQPGVVTLVGAAGPGYLDGPAATAKLQGVEAIAVDPAGNLWVGETANHRIRKITPDGLVSTVAGTGVSGFADGPGAEAQFGRISGLAMDNLGTLYIADMANKRIRKLDTLDPAFTVSTVAENLENPACLTLDELGGSLYVTEFSGLDLQQVGLNGASKQAATGFTEPWGVAVLPGEVFVADAGVGAIKQLDPDGTLKTFATGFGRPQGLAPDGTGRLVVSDEQKHQLYRVGAEGATEVFAGSGTAGDADGPQETAQFRAPKAIAVGPDGAVYVVDRIGDRIRVIRQ
jgi:hypothetical protein